MKCYKCIFFIASCIEDTREKEFVQVLKLHFTMLVHALGHWGSWRSRALLKETFKTTTTKKTKPPKHSPKHTTHFKNMIIAPAGEENCLPLRTESHQHTETEDFYGSRKLYFSSYLALCSIL